MRESLITYLCCPVDRSPLRLEAETRRGAEIVTGHLRSETGRTYDIVDGIPHLVVPSRDAAETATVTAFGKQWAHYDNVDGYMGSAELFTEFTGLDPSSVAGRTVLEVGCGGGRWLKVLAELGAKEVVGLEFSTAVQQAAERTKGLSNVHVVRGSALVSPIEAAFDLVVSLGVIHHLADPVLGLSNIHKAVAPQHLVVIVVYAREGNRLYLSVVSPLRKVMQYLPDRVLLATSRCLALGVWSYIHTVNRAAVAAGIKLPLRDYLAMLSRLRFRDVEVVVYDQLAPQIARYPTRGELTEWVEGAGGRIERMHHRTGNSWQCHFRF